MGFLRWTDPCGPLRFLATKQSLRSTTKATKLRGGGWGFAPTLRYTPARLGVRHEGHEVRHWVPSGVSGDGVVGDCTCWIFSGQWCPAPSFSKERFLTPFRGPELGLAGYGIYHGIQTGDWVGAMDAARNGGGGLRGLGQMFMGRAAIGRQLGQIGARYARSASTGYRTRALGEADGMLGAYRKMSRRGYRMNDVDLQYRGNSGIDMLFSRFGSRAVLEAKGGATQFGRILGKSQGQGSPYWSRDRLNRYLLGGNNTRHTQLAEDLRSGIRSGGVRTFGYTHADRSLWSLSDIGKDLVSGGGRW